MRFHGKMYTKANLAALRVKKDIAEVRRENTRLPRGAGTKLGPTWGCLGTGQRSYFWGIHFLLGHPSRYRRVAVLSMNSLRLSLASFRVVGGKGIRYVCSAYLLAERKEPQDTHFCVQQQAHHADTAFTAAREKVYVCVCADVFPPTTLPSPSIRLSNLHAHLCTLFRQLLCEQRARESANLRYCCILYIHAADLIWPCSINTLKSGTAPLRGTRKSIDPVV